MKPFEWIDKAQTDTQFWLRILTVIFIAILIAAMVAAIGA